jgi:heme oxygenase
MKTLKELTWEHHKEAERQKFVKVLMSGKIIPEIYAIYLANQHKTYDVLEAMAMADGLLDEARTCFNFATNLFKDIDKFINDNEKRFGDGTEK